MKFLKSVLISTVTIISILLLYNPTIIKADSLTSDSTNTEKNLSSDDPSVNVPGTIVEEGKLGTASYYINDQNVLYLTDGELEKNGRFYESHPNITKVDTSLASKGGIKAPENSSSLFEGWENVTDFDLSNLNTSNVTNMYKMFANDTSAKNIDVSNFDTSKVESMFAMFAIDLGGVDYPKGIQSLDISNWDLSSLTNCENIFLGTDLRKITLGPKNKFNDQFNIDKPYIYASIGGWQNIGSGTADDPKGNLKIPSNKDITWSDIYDGSEKNGVETFVPYDVKYYDPINVEQNIYLNGNLKTTKKYQINFSKTDLHLIGPDNLSNPNIPSDWTNEKRSLLTLKDSTGEIIKGGVLNEEELSDVLGTIDLINLTEFLLTTSYEGQAGYTATLDTYYSGEEETTTNPGSNNNSEIPLIPYTGKISTYFDKSNVTLWSLNRNGNGSLTKITHRALAPDSNWNTDKKVTINGVDYFRVSTNEWVKASEVYPYQDFNGIVQTNTGTHKNLHTADNKHVKDRALAPKTDWRSDYVINLNGTKHYRVSNNEFVSENDITVK